MKPNLSSVLNVENRSPILRDFDWSKCLVDDFGPFIIGLMETVSDDGEFASDALSRALEGVEVLVGRGVGLKQFDAIQILKSAAVFRGSLSNSGADPQQLEGLLGCIDALAAVAESWISGKNLADPLLLEALQWLNIGRLLCECHAAGAKMRRLRQARTEQDPSCMQQPKTPLH